MLVVLTCALILASLTQQTQAGSAGLEARLRETIASSGAEVAVAYRTLDGGDEVLIDPDKAFHAASTMKVPVMIELFRQAAEGRFRLDDPLPIQNEFKSIVDGTPYKLSEGDDSDKEIYAAVGKSLSYRQLCEAMITVSSNFATNLLIEKLGAGNVRKTVSRLGGDGMNVLRGVEDQKAFDKGLNNTTTARGLLVLLEKIAAHKAVDPESDAEMIEILKRQKFNDAIPAGLPRGIPVAHKTGSITRINHDAGIVYASRPYALVLLVRGIQNSKESAALMAKLSKMIYQASQGAGSAGAFGQAGQDGSEDGGLPQGRQERLHRNRPAGERQIRAIQQRVEAFERLVMPTANGVMQRRREGGFAAPPATAQRPDCGVHSDKGGLRALGIAGRLQRGAQTHERSRVLGKQLECASELHSGCLRIPRVQMREAETVVSVHRELGRIKLRRP